MHGMKVGVPIWQNPEFSAPLGPYHGYDLSGVSFRKKQSPDPGLCHLCPPLTF